MLNELFTQQDLVFKDFVPAVLIILVGVGIGLVIQLVIFAKLKDLLVKTRNEYDDRYANAFGNTPIYLAVIISSFFAKATLPFVENSETLINRVLMALTIIVITMVFAKISAISVEIYMSKSQQQSSLFKNIARIIVYILGFLILSQSLGINITAVLTALGVGGLAVALALQDTLTNLFSGFYILAARKIKPGDYIEVDSGETGYVQDISWRNTTIRALQNHIIIVPNAKLASATVNNYHLPEPEMSVLVDVGVSYNSDLKKVEKVTLEVACEVMKKVEGGVPDNDPFLRYNKFADSSINFTVIMRCREYVDQFLVTHEFIKALHERYKKEKIEIPFPQIDVHTD